MAATIKVLVKWKDAAGRHQQKACLLTRVPSRGEHIVLDRETRYEYRVMMVVHIAYGGCYAAEIFAVHCAYGDESEV